MNNTDHPSFYLSFAFGGFAGVIGIGFAALLSGSVSSANVFLVAIIFLLGSIIGVLLLFHALIEDALNAASAGSKPRRRTKE